MKALDDFLRKHRSLSLFLDNNRDLVKKAAIITLVIIAAFFVFLIKGEETETESPQEEVVVTEPAPAGIFVDISGEVKEPGLAELDDGSRVEDAIRAAGGLTDKADTSDINRAAFVEDGEKISIPAMQDTAGGEMSRGKEAQEDGRIDINTADSVKLQEITGVGPVTAGNIISYREENGRFGDIEELKNVSGIGDKTFEKMQDQIKI